MEEVYISRYTLRAKTLLNSVAGRREFSGVLIRIGSGHGCIHPWPELGDPPLAKCLKDLVGARRYSLVRRALHCAELDGAARDNGDWMFEDAEVPESHATVTEVSNAAIEKALVAGFGTAKIKVGRDADAEARLINQLLSDFPQLRLRLDANSNFGSEDFLKFASALGEAAKGAIDFIEDPADYSESEWQHLGRESGLRLAVDRDVAVGCRSAAAYVLKPAVEEPYLLVEDAISVGKLPVITSYMDHPLGQAFAAWEAVRMNAVFPESIGLCGLQTHGLFRENAYSYELGPVVPQFTPAAGTGLGFDDLLAAEPWELLDPFSL